MVDGQQETSDEGMQSVAPLRSTVETREIYRIVLEGNWNDLIIICGMGRYFQNIIFFSPITLASDGVLHFVVQDKAVLQILLRHLKNMTDEDQKRALSMQNYYGNTPLHMAASLENSDATKLLLNESAQLFYTRNKSGETAMFRAATFGRKKVLKFLFKFFMKNHREGDEDFLDKLEDQCVNEDGLSILHVAVRGRHIGLPVKVDDVDAVEGTFIPNKFQRVIGEISMTVLNFLAKGYLIDYIRKKNKKHEFAKELTRLLAAKDLSWELSYLATSEDGDRDKRNNEKDTTSEDGDGDKRNNEKDTTSEDGDGDKRNNEKDTDPNNTFQLKPLTPANLAAILAGSNVQQKPSTPSNPLLLAASNGIKETTDIILDEYPQAIDHVPANLQNILHVTIQHHHKEVFRDLNQRLKRNRWSMERLVRRTDKEGNNILHQVGTIAYFRDEGLTNPSLLLQDELKWFERVKKLVPEHYITARNVYGKTPKQYFDDEHKKQLEEAHNWAKDTSQSCSAIAAFVATIVFAAAFTVPGGSDKGIPFLLGSPLFKTFTFTDIFALGTSLASLVLFFSVLMSTFRYEDFRASIPRRMQFGFYFLLLSIASSTVTFTVTILLTTGLKSEWTKSLISIVGLLPVLIFLLNNSGFQFPWNTLKDFLLYFRDCSLFCFERSCKRTKPDDLENPEATQDA